jgi:hypothetical protein
MLASITPLGERSRGFTWWHTALAFAVGAIAAGATGGALLGLLGALVVGGARPVLVLAIVAAATAVDVAGVQPPSSRRQVNEDWLGRYRGWVYGVGFGGQLGVGVATIVTTAATYATVVRAAALLAGRRVADTAGLMGLHQRLLAVRAPARRATVALELAALVAVVALVIT